MTTAQTTTNKSRGLTLPHKVALGPFCRYLHAQISLKAPQDPKGTGKTCILGQPSLLPFPCCTLVSINAWGCTLTNQCLMDTDPIDTLLLVKKIEPWTKLPHPGFLLYLRKLFNNCPKMLAMSNITFYGHFWSVMTS